MLTVATTPEQAKQVISEWKAQGLSVGLVPTMGYLHEGHESLIKRAVTENDRVMVSVFVNPIQFAPGEDLETYPRDFDADKRLIEGAGATLVFHPEPADLYFPDACTYVNVEGITAELCGKTRPTHFRGVCTVVNKLMNISQADRAYFGQKDAQQLAVIRRMVRDLNMNVQVVGCPIVREEDGLAKSSRNTYLSAEERAAALVLSRAVAEGQRLMEAGERSAATVLDAMKQLIEAEPLARIDYVEMVSWDGIKPVETVDGPVLVAMAVYILYPSYQDLRPTEFVRDNFFTHLAALIYRADTPTGVCPSLHVAYSLGIGSCWLKEKQASKLWKAFVVFSVITISLSTAVVKQHSVIDIAAALPLGLLAEILVFKDYWKDKFRRRKAANPK